MSYPGASGAGPGGAIDLRSDTVTRPDAAMRAVMAAAEVGDDVYGDDPTVVALEAAVAGRFGKPAAAFFPSGTQSNLAALLAHCGRGDEVLVGRGYHIECAEARGASVLGGIGIEALPTRDDMGLEPETVSAAVKPDDSHYAMTRLLCVENTVGGFAIPLDVHDSAVTAGRAAGLAVHLDGARVFNAATALDVAPARLARDVHTVSVCLSKGLGAPAGSVLCGEADTVGRARRWRKMLGGGMRQAGVLAAAGLHALEHNVAGLADDQRRATVLRDGLRGLPGLTVDARPGQTNMVWVALDGMDPVALVRHMAAAGVAVSPGTATLRLALHRDVDDAGVDTALAAFRSFARQEAHAA